MDARLIAGDSGCKLVMTATDSGSKQPIDLTGARVEVRYQLDQERRTLDGKPVISPLMTDQIRVVNAEAGRAEYVLDRVDLAKSGVLKGDFRIHLSNGAVFTSLSRFALPIGKRT